jgi:tellurite resistance protein TehA-like permease
MTTELARLQHFGPNWFASVMGTGIVATAGVTLPVHVPGLHVFSRVVWVVASVLLVLLVVAVTVQWARHPTVAGGHVHNPQMTHFYGAAPMGLMPVVPPMVSAASGALLIPHMAAGTGRTTMLYSCYAMFGLSLVAALIIISMIWSRLALYGTSGTTRVPTLWIVLGPLGQGITAAGLLGANAKLAVPPELASGMNVFAVLFGVPVWGFAVLWIVLATELTARTLRRGMPFALTWWSLTFPVGTFVTGTTQLANHTGLPAFKVAAAAAYFALLGTWGLVAVQTARGSVGGSLFTPPPAAGPIKAKKDPPPSG